MLSKEAYMKGQVSMEYVMVATFIALIVIPIAFLAFSFSRTSSAEIGLGQIDKMGNDIVKTAEKVFYQGSPSRITIIATMPDGVENIRIDKDWDSGQNELVFTTVLGSGINELAFPSKVNIAGSFTPESITSGQKSIRIESIDNSTSYVLITII